MIGYSFGTCSLRNFYFIFVLLLGLLVPDAFAATPTLTNPGFTSTFSNPVVLSGTADTNSTVEVYANTILQNSVDSSTGGTFSIETSLYDGANTIYVRSVNKTTGVIST